MTSLHFNRDILSSNTFLLESTSMFFVFQNFYYNYMCPQLSGMLKFQKKKK